MPSYFNMQALGQGGFMKPKLPTVLTSQLIYWKARTFSFRFKGKDSWTVSYGVLESETDIQKDSFRWTKTFNDHRI